MISFRRIFKIGIDLDGLSQILKGLFMPFLPRVNAGTVIIGSSLIRVQLNRPVVILNRLIVSAEVIM